MIDIFTNKIYLIVLVTALPLLITVLVIADHKRRKAITRLLSSKMAEHLIDPRGSRLRRISEAFLLTGLAFIMLALARPVLGTKSVPQPISGRDIIFMLDVSQSMLAEDQPPCRLEYAKNSIMDCLDSVRQSRAALVAFAGSTSIKCPLTKDFEFFRSTLKELQPDSVAVGGTRLGDAINKTIEKILAGQNTNSCDVIIITDGESHTDLNTNAISRMAESKANLIIIGIGSDKTPAEIPILAHDSRKKSPLLNNGKKVYTLQDSKRLQTIADLIPGSTYINAGTNPFDLADIYRAHQKFTSTAGSGHKMIKRAAERYSIFLLAAMVCIAASFLPEFYTAKTVASKSARLIPLAIIILSLSSGSANAKSRKALFQEGLAAYKSGNFKNAVKYLSEAEQKKTDPSISFNLGTAYYRLGDMQNALLNFSIAAESAESDLLAVDAIYNTGNTLFSAALDSENISREKAILNLQQSIAAYQSVISIVPDHTNAIFNLDASRKFMLMLQQPAPNNNSNNDDSENEQNSDEDSDQNSTADSKDSQSGKADKAEDEEISAPNLTPDDIIKEEDKNNLKRSRKKHSDFGKVKMNW